MFFFPEGKSPMFGQVLPSPRNDPQGPKGPEDADAFEEAAAAGHGQIHDAHNDLPGRYRTRNRKSA
jgi:hypothetical protein